MSLHPSALIHPGARISGDVTIGPWCVVENDVVIGAGTSLGPFCRVLSDSELGENVTLDGGAVIGGLPQDLKYRGEPSHTRIGAGAIVSGMTGVHQFTVIGAGAFVGGGLRVDVDVPPFCKALGEPVRWGGLNLTGLRRGGADTDTAAFLEAFYRKVYGENSTAALAWMKNQNGFESEKAALENFFENRKRGLLRRRA
jgi:UDP-N-acetylglucosamine acyltransferase